MALFESARKGFQAILLAGVLAVVLAMAGCGGSASTDKVPTTEEDPVPGITYPDDPEYPVYVPDDPQPVPAGEKDCTTCFGSGKCQLCAGRGDTACPGNSCSNGRCTACDHGYYRRGDTRTECIVCHGDGLCDICGGSGRRDCGLCKTTGECTRCGGTGKLIS